MQPVQYVCTNTIYRVFALPQHLSSPLLMPSLPLFSPRLVLCVLSPLSPFLCFTVFLTPQKKGENEKMENCFTSCGYNKIFNGKWSCEWVRRTQRDRGGGEGEESLHNIWSCSWREHVATLLLTSCCCNCFTWFCCCCYATFAVEKRCTACVVAGKMHWLVILKVFRPQRQKSSLPFSIPCKWGQQHKVCNLKTR